MTTAMTLVVVILAAFIVRSIFFPPGPATTGLNVRKVSRATISSTVTGTGNVEPITQINVNFKASGTLTEVDVKPGDSVTAGQNLAKIDPTQLQSAVDTAQHNLATATTSYNDTASSVAATNSSDSAAIASDQAAINTDNSAIATDKSSAAYTIAYPYDNAFLQTDQMAVSNAQTAYTTTDNCLQSPQPNSALCTADQNAVNTARANVTKDQTAVNNDLAQFNSDTKQLSTDSSKLASDQGKQSSDQVSGQQRLDSSQTSLTAAQDAIATPTANLSEATLTAPISGTILSVNGVAGDSVAAGTTGSGSQLAPGTTAPLPSSSSTGSGSSGSAFITLVQTNTWVAVAPFAETDAALIKPGQPAVVTFDALSGVSLPGTVLAVAGTSTTVSSVVNYYVTVSLTTTDPGLKTGMTANAVITTQSATGVLVVPNNALHTYQGQPSVTLLVGGKKTETIVTTGLSDSRNTEIQSGVQLGDQVVLPTVTVVSPTTTGTTTGRTGGGGGTTFGGGAGTFGGGFGG
jgi:multidrug efflux pump subunit AcrA (membrane-fusion protein)